MRLVDTSAWIEWLRSTPTGEKVRPLLPDRTDWLVPTIVQFELAKWLRREVGEAAADDAMAFTQLCVVVPLTTELALLAVDLGSQFRLATADAVIYATATSFGADLLTCDAHFSNLEQVVLVPKAVL